MSGKPNAKKIKEVFHNAKDNFLLHCLPKRLYKISSASTWTKCLVKIEAIKCFPCYLRITFIRNVEDESANLCVRINIPGITIRLASSRTKAHSYGIFWNNNRKRCCIFFAFDTQTSCERHMKWFKKSLKNLELHRQEILETRRISRRNSSIIDLTKIIDMSNFMNYNNTSDQKNLQDILGPLPKIPDPQDSNWSRRVSGISDIYEEIPDPRRESRRISRASGIYEEMKAPLNIELFRNKKSEFVTPLPPPLPPRKRANTNQIDQMTIPRCNTNPEIEINKKKNYLHLLENVFIGRSKRSESVSEGKVSLHEELIDSVNTPDKAAATAKIYSNEVTPRAKRKFPYILNKNRRNSFSSPDLSKINHFDEFEALDDLSSISSELQINNCCSSIDNIASADFSSRNAPFTFNELEENYIMNISEQITSNFNISCNSSTVNLVGANLNASTINLVGANMNSQQAPNKVLVEDISGYCAMAPIRTDRFKNSTISIAPTIAPKNEKQKITNNDSDKENDVALFKPPLCFKSTLKNVPINSVIQKIYENIKIDTIYQNLMESSKKPDLIPVTLVPEDKTKSIEIEIKYDDKKIAEEDYYKMPRKSIISVDDKVPSYYPNSCDTKKTYRQRTNSNDRNNSSIHHLASAKVSHSENLYISSPQKILDQRTKLMKKRNLEKSFKACKISDNVYSVQHSNENVTNSEDDQSSPTISIEAVAFSDIQNIDFTFDDSTHIKKIDGNMKLNGFKKKLIANRNGKNDQQNVMTTPKIYQKYSTLSRFTTTTPQSPPSKESPLIVDKTKSTTKTTPEISTTKKFTSLPRFKKIDFSPLKLKINNVLQRHHSDGL